MAVQRNPYIDMELEWLEQKALEMKEFVDKNPFNTLKDRMSGNKVISKIEAQHTNIRNTLKDYAQLIEVVARLREGREVRKLVRGDALLTPVEDGNI